MYYPHTAERFGTFRKALINLFILCFFGFSAIWFFSPMSSRLPTPLRQLNGVWSFFGIYQRWTPFAPWVPHANISGTAVITLANGMTRLWEFPRMDRMSLRERFYRQYWSKIVTTYAFFPRFKRLQPDMARYIAAKCASPDNPAEMVSITAHYGLIPPPERLVRRANLPRHTWSHTFFVYRD